MKTTGEKYRDSHILNITTIPKPHPTHPTPNTPSPPISNTYHIPPLKRLKATPHTKSAAALQTIQLPEPPPNPPTSQPQKTPSHLPHTHQKLGFSFAPRFRKKLWVNKRRKEQRGKKTLCTKDVCRKKPRFPTPVKPASPPTPSRAGECVSCQVGETDRVVGKRGAE